MTYDALSLSPQNNMSDLTVYGWHANCIVKGTSNHDWEVYNTALVSLRCVKAVTDGESL